jgi:hypothetical protein
MVLPAGQYALIGNPTGMTMTVTGADAVYAYDPTSGTYRQATTLGAGQGAWAYSANGATVSLSRATTTANAPGS